MKKAILLCAMLMAFDSNLSSACSVTPQGGSLMLYNVVSKYIQENERNYQNYEITRMEVNGLEVSARFNSASQGCMIRGYEVNVASNCETTVKPLGAATGGDCRK